MRAILFLALSACAADETAEQEEALTEPSLPTPPSAPPHIPGTRQVCFLAGVNGPLASYEGPPPGGKHPAPPAPVQHSLTVYDDGTISAQNASGEVACVTVFEDSIHDILWGWDGKGNQNGSYTGNDNTWCFLKVIYSGGLDPGRIALSHTGNKWDFSTSYAGTSALRTFAEATCFDYAAGSRWGYWLTATTPLLDYYPGGPPVPTAGVTCGLTALDGDWTPSYTQAWLDRTGTYLTYDVHNGVSMGTNCFR